MPANTPPGLLNAGFKKLTQSNSTAVGLNSTIQTNLPDMLDLSVETNAVRMRADGTDPATSTGVLLEKDVHHRIAGIKEYANLKFMRAAGGTAIVNVQAWKYPGA